VDGKLRIALESSVEEEIGNGMGSLKEGRGRKGRKAAQQCYLISVLYSLLQFEFFLPFYPCDAMLAWVECICYGISVRLSMCLSVSHTCFVSKWLTFR